MYKALTFAFNEFKELIKEVSYDTMDIDYDMYDSWYWTIKDFSNDLEYESWLEEYGKEAEAEIDYRYDDDDNFIYRMIGKKYGATVKTVVVDVKSYVVAVIFE